jgi:hypothetical protein
MFMDDENDEMEEMEESSIVEDNEMEEIEDISIGDDKFKNHKQRVTDIKQMYQKQVSEIKTNHNLIVIGDFKQNLKIGGKEVEPSKVFFS